MKISSLVTEFKSRMEKSEGRYLAELTQTRKRLFEAERAARLLRDARDAESKAMSGETAQAQQVAESAQKQAERAQEDAERAQEEQHSMERKLAEMAASLESATISQEATLSETVAADTAERKVLQERADAAETAAAATAAENEALQKRLAEVRALQATLVGQIKRVQLESQKAVAEAAAMAPQRQITVLDLERQRKQGAATQKLRDEAAALRRENSALAAKADAAAMVRSSATGSSGGISMDGGAGALVELRRVTTQLLQEQTKRAVAEEKLRRFEERMKSTHEELRYLKKQSTMRASVPTARIN